MHYATAMDPEETNVSCAKTRVELKMKF